MIEAYLDMPHDGYYDIQTYPHGANEMIVSSQAIEYTLCNLFLRYSPEVWWLRLIKMHRRLFRGQEV